MFTKKRRQGMPAFGILNLQLLQYDSDGGVCDDMVDHIRIPREVTEEIAIHGINLIPRLHRYGQRDGLPINDTGHHGSDVSTLIA